MMSQEHVVKRQGIELICNSIEGKSPRVIFCPGFYSNRHGEKALLLESWCQTNGYAYTRFDYSGHGDSSGDFADGCISDWLADLLSIIDASAEQQVLLVGSSMGGWLALLAGLQRAERVSALMLLACAADMTKYYPKRLASFEQQTDSNNRAFYAVPNQFDDQQPYLIYQHLIDDGEQYFLLDKPIELTIPVRLLHGMQDDIVEWQRSLQVTECLVSSNVELSLIKSGSHRLSEPADLRRLAQEMTLLMSAL